MLLLTTSEPGFLGTTEDKNEDFVAKMINHGHEIGNPFKMEGFKEGQHIAPYFHGTLERNLGYDIPIPLQGTLKNTEEKQECLVYDVSGEKLYPAVLVLWERKGDPDRFMGLIVLRDEYDKIDWEHWKNTPGV